MPGTSTRVPLVICDRSHRLHLSLSAELLGCVTSPSGPVSSRIMSLMKTASDPRDDLHPKPLSRVPMSFAALRLLRHTTTRAEQWPCPPPLAEASSLHPQDLAHFADTLAVA